MLEGTDRVGFAIGDYDASLPLVIDPVLDYSTYFEALQRHGYEIAVDSSGNAYVTGYANSAFPTTDGAKQNDFGGGFWDAFVTKLNAEGTEALYSTYFGGRR